MEPPVPVLAIPADLTALSIGTAGLASAQKTAGKNNVHGKKNTTRVLYSISRTGWRAYTFYELNEKMDRSGLVRRAGCPGL